MRVLDILFPERALLRGHATILLNLEAIMLDLSELKSKVEANTAVTESAITLLAGLKEKLDAAIASEDPAALKALSDQLGAETDKLAAAVTANTPAA